MPGPTQALFLALCAALVLADITEDGLVPEDYLEGGRQSARERRNSCDPGCRGFPGFPGSMGRPGPPGPEGPPGTCSSSCQGASGSPTEGADSTGKGNSCQPGCRGFPGSPGFMGRPGPPGPEGPPGTCPSSCQGASGSPMEGADSTGKGNSSQPGCSGPRGEKGPRGYPGLRGPVGLRGQRGPQGPPGACPTLCEGSSEGSRGTRELLELLEKHPGTCAVSCQKYYSRLLEVLKFISWKLKNVESGLKQTDGNRPLPCDGIKSLERVFNDLVNTDSLCPEEK